MWVFYNKAHLFCIALRTIRHCDRVLWEFQWKSNVTIYELIFALFAFLSVLLVEKKLRAKCHWISEEKHFYPSHPTQYRQMSLCHPRCHPFGSYYPYTRVPSPMKIRFGIVPRAQKPGTDITNGSGSRPFFKGLSGPLHPRYFSPFFLSLSYPYIFIVFCNLYVIIRYHGWTLWSQEDWKLRMMEYFHIPSIIITVSSFF